MGQAIYMVRGLGVPERAFRSRADAEQYSASNLLFDKNPFTRGFLDTQQNALVLYPLFFNNRDLTHYFDEVSGVSYEELYRDLQKAEPDYLPFPLAPADRPQPHIAPLATLESLVSEIGLGLPGASGERKVKTSLWWDSTRVEPWYTWWEEVRNGLTEKQQRLFWSRTLPYPHAIVELEWEE